MKSSSFIFAASSVYYLLLSAMRFMAVMFARGKKERDRQAAAAVGIMLMVLSVMFHLMVMVSMKYQTAAVHGTIPMIAIATFTFTKITMAAISAVKYRRGDSKLIKAINNIRYSEVAVSLLTMQQSMLVSFGEGDERSATILNACTGAAVCFFILALGIITLRNSRKEEKK